MRSTALLASLAALMLLSPAAAASAATATAAAAIPASAATAAPASPRAATAEDPYLWLESVTGKRALDWVSQRDRECTTALAGTAGFKTLEARLLEILNSSARIPAVTKIGDRYYNFWRDAQHERGVWRRTTLDEYRKDAPAWETVLDLDSLARAEKENWVWREVDPLPPDYTRCLISLSRGGADATVVREFDLATRSFVTGGFSIPESKSTLSWIGRDSTYVAAAFDSSTMTASGYPRVVEVWRRGTPLSAASAVFEGKHDDVDVEASHDPTPGFERDVVQENLTTYTNKVYLRRGGSFIRIDKPDDAVATFHREWLLLELRTDWTTGGRTYPAGALIVTRLEGFLAGKRDFEVLFQPTEHAFLAGVSPTKDAILIHVLDDVKGRAYALRHGAEGWSRTEIPGLPEFGRIGVKAVDDLESDDYWATAMDFLTPGGLYLGTAGQGPPARLKQEPAFFDAAGLTVSQHEAVSKDGTKVPYFEVAPRGLKPDGSAPTLLTGYGGFEIPMTPFYSGTVGAGWLTRGGVFVLANIRGGGEFGPRWHQAAVRENRPRAYEDFIAVAEDLVRRRVTSPARLGCIGGSNGGLLVGNVLTMRPDLFGAVVCQSPLLDMKRYHELLAGASWMEEYGNPDDPAQWRYIRTFSPYQNVRKDVKYPPVLFTSSTRDDRVHPGHARKMVARMRAQGHDVLYYENVEGGHPGAANSRERAFMSALTYTFLWEHLGPARGGVAAPVGGPGRP